MVNIFVAGAEAAHFEKVGAFVGGTVAPGAAFAVVVEDPAAVGVGADFEAAGVVGG